MAGWGKTPLEITDYDNPETVRVRKYATGAHLLATHPPEVGQTPREVIWEKHKARVYRYEPAGKKEHPVPVLLVYALTSAPTSWTWCRATALSSTCSARVSRSICSTGAYPGRRTRASRSSTSS